MNSRAALAQAIVELHPGACAAAPGVLWLAASRTVVAADAHLAYEDVIGGALPTWSTADVASQLRKVVERLQARELVLLGDIIHGSRMSEGAAQKVQAALAALRATVRLTLVAGNHEGRTRGRVILGETVESIRRDGWLLVHGDRAPASAGEATVIGHLHPALVMEGGAAVPAFLIADRLIVLPAMTPYSRGLNVLSDACLHALAPFNVASRAQLSVVAATSEMLYPFGRLRDYGEREEIEGPHASRFARKVLRPDP